MRTPDKPGTYTATWSLQVGHQYFCGLTITVNVR
jgi:hypothetical protein